MDTKIVLELLAKIQPAMYDAIHPQQEAQVFQNHGFNQGQEIAAVYRPYNARFSWKSYVDNIICQDLSLIIGQTQLLAHIPKENAAGQKQALLELITDYEDDWCGTSWPKKFPPRPKGLEMADYTLEDRVNAAVRFYQASFAVKDNQIESKLVDAAVRILEVATTSKEIKEAEKAFSKSAGIVMS